jgi:shikimate kinase
MRRLGTTIFLDVPVDVLIDRLERSKKRRPLLQGEGMEDKVRTILEARMPLYEQADVRVNLGDLDARDGAALVLAAMGVTP